MKKKSVQGSLALSLPLVTFFYFIFYSQFSVADVWENFSILIARCTLSSQNLNSRYPRAHLQIWPACKGWVGCYFQGGTHKVRIARVCIPGAPFYENSWQHLVAAATGIPAMFWLSTMQAELPKSVPPWTPFSWANPPIFPGFRPCLSARSCQV